MSKTDKTTNKKYSQNDLGVAAALKDIYSYIRKDKKQIFRSVNKYFQYYDDPQYYGFHCDIKYENKLLNGIIGEGYSFVSEELALLKCLVEGIERYSLYDIRKKIFYAKLQDITEKHIHPLKFVAFSSKQLESESMAHCRIDRESNFGWVEAFSATEKHNVLVPAQLVYLSYELQQGEPMIHVPLSTGSAGERNIYNAVYNGICETLERDAFIITYLNKLPRQRVNLSAHPLLKTYDTKVTEHCLELYLFDITTDLEIYSFLAIVIDRSGVGPAISIGLHAGLDPLRAMIGAIEESFHTRLSTRRNMLGKMARDENIMIHTISQRGLYWSTVDKIHLLDFLFQNKNLKDPNSYTSFIKNNYSNLEIALEILKKHNYNVVFADLTNPRTKGSGIYIVKVLIPDMQPIYLNEGYKYLGGKRLYQVPVTLGYMEKPLRESDLYQVPHPFL